MKTSKVLSLLCFLAILAGSSACSNEQNTDTPPTVTDDTGESALRIQLQTPAPEKIIMQRALNDAAEYDVKKLSLYLFLSDNPDNPDSGFKLAYDEEGVVEGNGNGQFTQGGAGSLNYSIPIKPEWLGKTACLALVANGGVSPQPVLQSTTLEDFKKSLAPDNLTGNDLSADRISGNIYATDAESSATGLVMTALARTDDSDKFRITPLGVDLTATLLRIMARIDVVNRTPNLTIQGVSVTGAAAQAYLFPQESKEAPSQTYYSLMPTGAYTEILRGDGLPYISAGTDEETTANTHKHLFYLYERHNTDNSPMTVDVTYSMRMGDVTRQAFISIPLKKDGSFVDVTRNNLYTIVLGNGNIITDRITATQLIVNDWEASTDISGELDPGGNDSTTPVQSSTDTPQRRK